MSAYVVEDRVISAVVSFIAMKAKGSMSLYEYGIHHLVELGYDLENDDAERLANDMFELNVRAINQQYRDNQAAQFRSLDFQYCFKLPGSIFGVLKRLECWSYQCTEGDIPEKSRLYQAMEKVADSFRRKIISNLPEYQAAGWG